MKGIVPTFSITRGVNERMLWVGNGHLLGKDVFFIFYIVSVSVSRIGFGLVTQK